MGLFDRRKIKKEARDNRVAINEAIERRSELYQRELAALYKRSENVEDDVFTALATALLSAYTFLAYLPIIAFANQASLEDEIMRSIIDFSLADNLFLS